MWDCTIENIRTALLQLGQSWYATSAMPIKNVGACHSTGNWASFQDTPAEWVEGVEGEEEVDRF